MKTTNIVKELLIIVIMLLPILWILTMWNSLPDCLPIHFSMHAKADGFGPKWLFVLMPLAMYLLFLVLPKIDPRKKNYTIFADTYYKLRLIMMLFFGVFNIMVVYSVLHSDVDLSRLMPALTFFLFMLLGNYMGNIRPNYFIGFKLPWTLQNDEVWRRTHVLAGKLWFWGGLIGIPLALFVGNSQVVTIVIVSVISIIPCVYAYWIYKKISKE